jgi:hypothetical protein
MKSGHVNLSLRASGICRKIKETTWFLLQEMRDHCTSWPVMGGTPTMKRTFQFIHLSVGAVTAQSV